MSSLASEDSLCRGGKEGGPQPLSWGLSDWGGRQHRHQRQLWQPGPSQAARCSANTDGNGKDVGSDGSPHCWMLPVSQGLGWGHDELTLCCPCIIISPFTDKE